MNTDTQAKHRTTQPAASHVALSLRDVRKRFGMIEIIRGVTLDIRDGERHAIIGPNGAGKSSLFHLITGRFPPTSGEILLNDRPIQGLPPHRINRQGLARSFQVTNVFPQLTVYENVRCASMWSIGSGEYSMWRSIRSMTAVRQRTQEVLDLVGLEARANVPAGALTYAEQRALEIALATAGNPKVILLDEPTAGMSASETAQAVELIRTISQGRTLVMVEHDMSVVFGLADRISVLVYGEIVASGTPAEVRANKAVQEAYLGTLEDET